MNQKSSQIQILKSVQQVLTSDRSQSREFSSFRLKLNELGSISNIRLMIFAFEPVASFIRLAACPVGAHNNIMTAFAARLWRVELTMREFLQVDDYADGLALFAKHNSKVEHLNFGFGTNIRIDDLARMVMDVVGLEVQLYKDISQYRLRCNLFCIPG